MKILSFLRRQLANARFRTACRRIASSGRVTEPNRAWRESPHAELWAHAGSGRLHVYGNSLEAFDDAIANGFTVLEADVMITADGVPVMSHRFRPNNEIAFDVDPTAEAFLSCPINERYTPLTLDGFVARYAGRNVFVAIDPSPSLRAQFGADYLLRHLQATAPREFQRRVIYLFSGVENLGRFVGIDWPGALHYSLDFDIGLAEHAWRVDELIPALKATGVGSVSFVDRPVTAALETAVGKFVAADIVVSAASVNSSRRFDRLKAIGVSCIDTDFVYP